MKSGGEKKQQKTYFCFCFEENDSDLIHADDARRARLSDRTTRVSTASMATASLQTRSLVTVCLRGSGWQGKRRVVTGSRVKTLNLVRASASSSSGETENRAPLETRLALALQEDTALTKNQNPIPPPFTRPERPGTNGQPGDQRRGSGKVDPAGARRVAMDEQGTAGWGFPKSKHCLRTLFECTTRDVRSSC